MSLHPLSASQAMAQLATFDAVIDARSELEFAEDHLPGAQNWLSLNNEERVRVGTLYKQVSPFEAQKRGAAMVAANIAQHIERHVLDLPKSWQPLVYCWRGGKRSGSLALVLGQIGFKVTLIEGGYKAYRQAMLLDLPQRVAPLQWRVICGPTGSGKTRLLQALRAEGAQVLDLEDLASHRSSVLGLIPGQPQPSQKHFDTLVWDALRQFDPRRPVYVESESRKVGNLTVPEPLMLAIRSSPCYALELSEDERVGLLLEDYDFFVKDRDFFSQRLQALTELRGKAVVEKWQSQIAEGQMDAVVRDLLLTHYDPTYASSLKRNFTQSGQAIPLRADNRSPQAMQALARQLVTL